MEPTLVVIGISLRSAKLAMRERFLLDAGQRATALSSLVRSDAVDEVIVHSNCNRTEFLVWTQDASEASNSILRFLTRCNNLKLVEWSNFYRLVGDAAVAHVLSVTSGSDSAIFGDPDAANSVLASWQEAQRAGTTGRFLDSLMAKAFNVAGRIRQELGTMTSMMTVAEAAVDALRGNLGDLKQRRILVLGAGQLAHSVVRELQRDEIGEITVINRSLDHAQQLARQCKVRAVHSEGLWEQVLAADAVLSAAAQRTLLTREELSVVMRERRERPLLAIDLAVPRTIDPEIRTLDGVTAFDLDDLCDLAEAAPTRRQAVHMAERIIALEAAGFRGKLLSEAVVPTISGMRERLEQICHEEMEQLSEQFGPFTEDQQLALTAFSAHITQRISATLARQLKTMPGRGELTTAIQQLFQLEELASERNVNLCD
ncbi:MAG: glutamyl-tRNA reductase [Acidobacteriota bacterium]|nr:glutamyl-tRNA reductase [Acidobacteriota bacterium]